MTSVQSESFRWLRIEVLAIGAAIGGALTLLGSLDPLIQLAGWARFIVEHWQEGLRFIWNGLFDWLSFEIPEQIRAMLTYIAFVLVVVDRAVAYPPNEAALTKHSMPSSVTSLLLLLIPAALVLTLPIEGINDVLVPWLVGAAIASTVAWFILVLTLLLHLRSWNLYPDSKRRASEGERGRLYWLLGRAGRSLVRTYLWLGVLVALNFVAVYASNLQALVEPPS